MPKLNKTEIIMKAQSLSPENAKSLLIYITSYCGDDAPFIQATHKGLQYLEKMGWVAKAEATK